MGAIDGILGMVAGPVYDTIIGDQKQRRQKELMDYQQKHQLEMWEKTNYPAQVQQMKKAGLNPALMYGQAGTGGQLGGTAPSGGDGTGGTNPFNNSAGDIIGLMIS